MKKENVCQHDPAEEIELMITSKVAEFFSNEAIVRYFRDIVDNAMHNAQVEITISGISYNDPTEIAHLKKTMLDYSKIGMEIHWTNYFSKYYIDLYQNRIRTFDEVKFVLIDALSFDTLKQKLDMDIQDRREEDGLTRFFKKALIIQSRKVKS